MCLEVIRACLPAKEVSMEIQIRIVIKFVAAKHSTNASKSVPEGAYGQR